MTFIGKILVFVTMLFAAQNLYAFNCNDYIAIVPPKIYDPILGRKVVQSAIQYLNKNERLTCDVFIDFEETVELFDFLGMTFHYSRTPGQLSRKNIRSIVQETSANHLMFIEELDAKNQVFQASIYQVLRGENIREKKTFRFVLDDQVYRTAQTPSVLRWLTHIAPNNIMLGYSGTQIYFKPSDSYKHVESKTHEPVLPALVSSFSVSKIEHRKGYNTFDLSGSLFPGLFAFAVDQNTTIKKNKSNPPTSEDDKEEILHIEAYGACTTLIGEGGLYTLFGALFIGVGWGPCMFQANHDEVSKVKIHFATAGRYNLGYRAFVSENLNAFLMIDTVTFNNDFYESEFGRANSIMRLSAGFGWYFGDAETHVTKLLN